MEDIHYKNVQYSIKNLVNRYGLEGAYQLIEKMAHCDMKYKLLIEYDQMYKLYLGG